MKIWRNNYTRLFKLTEDKPDYFQRLAIELVEFCAPEERDGRNFRRGFVVVTGNLPDCLDDLEGLGRGEALQVVHALCTDPRTFCREDVIFTFADCELESKEIRTVVIQSVNDAAAIMMQVRLRCWIEISPDGGC